MKQSNHKIIALVFMISVLAPLSAFSAIDATGLPSLRTQSTQKTLQTLSRDTDNAHKALGKIFDKKKVEEQQEIAKVFGEEAFKLVGDISKSQTKPYEDAQLKYEATKAVAEKAAANGDTATQDKAEAAMMAAGADMNTYRADYDTWAEGSAIKIAMHAFVGSLTAKLGGGDAFSGGLGAGAAEYSRSMTENLPKDLQQWASVIIGGATAKLAGGNTNDAMTGAATALDGEKYNRQLHQDEKQRIKDLAKNYKELGYNSEAEAEKALDQAACAIVHCADQIPNNSSDKQEKLAIQKAGGEEDSKYVRDYLLAHNQPFESTYLDTGTGETHESPKLFTYNPVVDWAMDSFYANNGDTRVGGLTQGVVNAFGAAYAYTTANPALFTLTWDSGTAGFNTFLYGTPQNTMLNSGAQYMGQKAGLSPEDAKTVANVFELGTNATVGGFAWAKAVGWSPSFGGGTGGLIEIETAAPRMMNPAVMEGNAGKATTQLSDDAFVHVTTKGGKDAILTEGLFTEKSGFVTKWQYVKDVEDASLFSTKLYKQSLWPERTTKFDEGAYILKIESDVAPKYYSPFTNRINGVPQWVFEGEKIPPSQIELIKKVGGK
jgi:hypothetical protein